jgi:hypothetical protein
MSRIIEQALRAFNWGKHLPLPDYIANVIADAMPMPKPHPDHDDSPKLRTELAYWQDQAQAECKAKKSAERKLAEARAAQPHPYSPSASFMGDCLICGNKADAPQHKHWNWKERAEHAEKQFEISEASRDSMRHRMERAEATVAAIKEAMR